MLLGAVEGGGTSFRCAVGHADGTIEARARFPTTTPAETLARVRDWLAPRAVRAVGVGCFGPLELSSGRLAATPKPGWSGADLLGPLRALGVPLALHTDVCAAALGEHRRGAGQGVRGDLLYVTVGTGIGGGMVRDGRLPPPSPLHAELGHMPCPRQPDDPLRRGVCPFHPDCLEGWASGPALAARWGEAGEALPPNHPAWELEARYLTAGLQAALAVAAPERVVLGGGVGGNPALWPPLRRHLAAAVAAYWPRLEVGDWLRPAGADGDNTLIGGLVMAAGL